MTADLNIVGAEVSKTLIDDFASRRRAFEAAEEALKTAEAEYREIEEVLWDQMDAAGMKSIRVDGFGTLTRTLKGPYCSIDVQTYPDAAEAFEQWCEERGLREQIFRFAPQMSTLNPIVRDMRERGEQTPPGIKVTEHRRIQVTKGRG